MNFCFCRVRFVKGKRGKIHDTSQFRGGFDWPPVSTVVLFGRGEKMLWPVQGAHRRHTKKGKTNKCNRFGWLFYFLLGHGAMVLFFPFPLVGARFSANALDSLSKSANVCVCVCGDSFYLLLSARAPGVEDPANSPPNDI